MPRRETPIPGDPTDKRVEEINAEIEAGGGLMGALGKESSAETKTEDLSEMKRQIQDLTSLRIQLTEALRKGQITADMPAGDLPAMIMDMIHRMDDKYKKLEDKESQRREEK